MMFFRVASISAVMWVTALGGGMLTVDVGDEYAVRTVVEPAVTQLAPDGTVISSTMPEPPYAFEYRFDRTMVQYLRSDDNVTVTYEELAGTDYASLKCETSLPASMVYFRALRVTDAPVAMPVQGVTANGNPVEVTNIDRLEIEPKAATLRVLILGIENE